MGCVEQIYVCDGHNQPNETHSDAFHIGAISKMTVYWKYVIYMFFIRERVCNAFEWFCSIFLKCKL